MKLIKWFSLLYCRIHHWRIVSKIPEQLKKFVLVGAPHTSNWDFVLAVYLFETSQLNAKFAIKSEWLKGFIGKWIKSLGAIGIDRKLIFQNKKLQTTDILASYFKGKDSFVLAIAPEGSRSPKKKWKTGFYYIAEKANVPIVLATPDYQRKKLILGKVIHPSNFQKDMEEIMAFYKDFQGKISANFSLDQRFV